MKIAFVCRNNPSDRIVRSGVPYSIYHQLSIISDSFWIKPEVEGILNKTLMFLQRVLFKLLRIMGKNVLSQTPLTAYVYSKSVERQLKNREYDAIFCLDCVDFAYLSTSKPVFYRTDAIVHGFINYYTYNVPKWLQAFVKIVEENALQKCCRFFIPSEWIRDCIIKNKIRLSPEKLVLVETGANLDGEFVKYRLHKYNIHMELNMLFVGYNIKRKGIDEAFEAVRILNEKYKLKARLTVMGGKPSETMLSSGYVCYKGNMNKNIKDEYVKFYKEFENADLFIFPTKAECHGIVNCEAAAYGLPIFSYVTGGVPSYCKDEYNGRCLLPSAKGEDFAFAIYEAIANGKMEEYSVNSRSFYESHLNWDSWGKKVFPIIESFVTC